MAPRKHLVLDEDIHEALLQRKELTGSSISQVGNGILRSHIAATLLEHLLGEKLIEKGLITDQEYKDVLGQVDKQLRKEFKPQGLPIEHISEGRTVSGSWESQHIFESPVGSFQMLEVWARDSHQQPMGQHVHEVDEYIISLGGRCVFVLNGTPITLSKGNVLQIPAGAVHNAVPLDTDCHVLAIIVPALAEYSPKSAT